MSVRMRVRLVSRVSTRVSSCRRKNIDRRKDGGQAKKTIEAFWVLARARKKTNMMQLYMLWSSINSQKCFWENWRERGRKRRKSKIWWPPSLHRFVETLSSFAKAKDQTSHPLIGPCSTVQRPFVLFLMARNCPLSSLWGLWVLFFLDFSIAIDCQLKPRMSCPQSKLVSHAHFVSQQSLFFRSLCAYSKRSLPQWYDVICDLKALWEFTWTQCALANDHFV